MIMIKEMAYSHPTQQEGPSPLHVATVGQNDLLRLAELFCSVTRAQINKIKQKSMISIRQDS
jgi:hypothetical protein